MPKVKYVQKFSANLVVSDTYSERVEEFNPSEITLSGNEYAFNFWERVEITVDDELLMGSKKVVSGMYYLGTKMNLKDVERDIPNSKILIQNMKSNGWKFVVKTPQGQFFDFGEDDKIVIQ